MNNEYLWQKIGEDEDIAKLEKTLSVFRYRDSAPPALTIYPSAVPPRWKIAFALAASVVMVVVGGAVWVQMSSRSTTDIVFVHHAPNDAENAPAIETPSPETPTRDEGPKRVPIRRKEVSRTTAALVRRSKKARQIPHDAVIALTAEERFAYRQLMLALSISGEKLRVVQNAIDGVESKDSLDKQNER